MQENNRVYDSRDSAEQMGTVLSVYTTLAGNKLCNVKWDNPKLNSEDGYTIEWQCNMVICDNENMER